MSNRRKRQWCVVHYDYEFGYNVWHEFNTQEEAEIKLKEILKKDPHYKWEEASNSGLLIKSLLCEIKKKDE